MIRIKKILKEFDLEKVLARVLAEEGFQCVENKRGICIEPTTLEKAIKSDKIKALMVDETPVEEVITSLFKVRLNNEISATDLYEYYKDNVDVPVTQTKFGREMSKHFNKITKHNGIYYKHIDYANDELSQILHSKELDLNEYFTKSPGHKISAKKAYEYYCSNTDNPVTQTAFGIEMSKMFKKKRTGKGIFYDGVTFCHLV